MPRSALYIVLVAIFALWGGGMVAMKFSLESFSIVQVVFARVALAAVFYLCLIRLWWPLPYVKGDWKYLLALVTFEPCLFFIFETAGLAYTSASQAGIIAACFPLVTALAGWMVLGERMRPVDMAAMALAVVGVAGASYFATGGGNAPNPLLGNALMGLATLSAAGYAVCARFVTRRYSFLAISSIQAIGGSLVFLPFVLFSPLPAQMDNAALGGLLYLGVGVGIVAYLGFNYALQSLPAGVVALFGNLIPVFALIFAFTILKERLEPIQAAFVGLTLVGVFLSALPDKASRKAHTG